MTRAIWIFVLAAAALASPVIRDLSPRGAQRGKTITLTLRGDDLTSGARIETTLPAGISKLIPKEVLRPNSELPLLVEIKPDTPAGLYPIRVVTDDGLSNIALFAVGDYPEVEENEAANPKQSNDSVERAERVSPPVVINGTLGPADLDYYAFAARAGQRLVFEVEARRAGSAIDPAIEIFDSAGREMAKNDDAPGIGVDARLEVAFPKGGTYYVRVHDSRYSEQPQNFYRLKIGTYPYADGFFPLGWRRGEKVDVTFVGGNLAAPVKITTAAERVIRLPGSPALAMPFALSDQPETLEAQAAGRLIPGTILNGQIEQPGEVDRYRLAVEPGQRWVIDLAAASLGTSPLDALLTIYDGQGKKLGSRAQTGGVDPAVPVTVPAGVSELTVAVEDVLGRGGPAFGYRLEARPLAGDFSAELLTPFVNVPAGGTAQIAVLIRRRGYEGAVRVKIPDLPPGLRVAGGHAAPVAAAQDPNMMDMGYRTVRTLLTITAPADAPPRTLNLIVLAVTPDGSVRRLARGPGLVTVVRGDGQRGVTAPWLGVDLPLAIARPLPAALTTPIPAARISQGFEFPLQYRVKRPAGQRAGRVNNQESGNVGNLRVLRGPESKDVDAGSFYVATNFATPPETFDMLLSTQVEIDGRQVTLFAPAVEIQVVPGYQVELDQPQPLEIRGRVYREPTFEGGLVRLRAEELPEGVACPAVEVPSSQQEFMIKCEASAAAKRGEFAIQLVSSAPDTGRRAKEEYRIAPIEARLIVR